MKQWYASWKTEINNYWNQQNNFGMERIKVSIYAQDRASLKASLVGIGAPESKDLPAFLLCLQEELDL